MAISPTTAVSARPQGDGAAEPPCLTDGQLLSRYLERRDEDAFAALVARHGPMVWGVCRRLLSNVQDAEDAFQATFLVLVRKARSVWPREKVAPWLHGVARQTALKARTVAARRKARERPAAEADEPEAAGPDPWRDVRPLLDQELHGLPEKYRTPVVLCDLEGKTHKEAARQVGCPEGTLSARLSRARALLAKRLGRRGLAISAALLAATLAGGAARACVPAAVAAATVLAEDLWAMGLAADAGLLSGRAVALAKGVLRAMLLTKLKIVAAVVLAAGALAAGGAALAYGGPPAASQSPRAGEASPTPSDPAALALRTTEAAKPAEGPPPAGTEPSPEPKLPTVTGRDGDFAPKNIDQALEWMRGDNQSLQLFALRSLARLDAPYEPRQEEVAAQMQAMLDARDRLVASKSAAALVVWATKKQVPSLIKSLDAKFCRTDAMEALSRLKDERAIEPLARFLKSENKFTDRDPAAAALIGLGPAVETEVRKYLDDDKPQTREAAARVLKQIGKVDKDDDFNAALAALKDNNPFARKKAVAWFAAADPAHPRRAEAAKVLTAMYKDGDIFAKQAAVPVLCRWGSRKDVPLLLGALDEKMLGAPNRTLIINALGALGDEQALPVLGDLLANGFFTESDAAAAALVQFGPKAEEEALKRLDAAAPTAKVRVCKVLGEVGGKEGLKALQAEIDKARRDKTPGYEGVVESCQAAMKKIQERDQ